jgi:hypothetical protein
MILTISLVVQFLRTLHDLRRALNIRSLQEVSSSFSKIYRARYLRRAETVALRHERSNLPQRLILHKIEPADRVTILVPLFFGGHCRLVGATISSSYDSS